MNLEFRSLSDDKEASRLGEILSQCFNVSSDRYWDYYSSCIGLENFRIISANGKIAGGLAILPVGQWFGGREIPMSAIASVGILPEDRGTGIAKALMMQCLQELYAAGMPLSSLYPATQQLYRRVGYEQAGTWCAWEVPVDKLESSDRTLPINPVSLEVEQFSSLHQQWAQNNNGNLARSPLMWQLILEPPDEKVYAYQFGSENQPEGYIIFSQQSEGNLYIRDWAALTPQAIQRLWTFLADHRSQIKKAIWRGSLLDPLLLLLPEQIAQIRHCERWMLRIVNVEKALTLRGYPVGIEAELHLEVQDRLLPENNGKWILSVAEGKAEVTRGGRGNLRLDVKRLAPLYSGLLSPHQLQLTGQLEAEMRSRLIATQLFSGLEPWMSDKF